MKYLMGVILSLISSAALAGAIPFPVCTINNQPVSYISVPADFDNAYAQHGNVHIAGSNIVKGKAIIDYNPSLLSTKPKEWNLQVMLHECAHLKLSHVTNSRKTSLTKEYEADCYSASILKNEYGYTDKEFDIITNTMSEFIPRNRVRAFKSCIDR